MGDRLNSLHDFFIKAKFERFAVWSLLFLIDSIKIHWKSRYFDYLWVDQLLRIFGRQLLPSILSFSFK